MAVTLTSSGITFSDGNSQNTVASGGVSLNHTNTGSPGSYSKPGNSAGVLVGLYGGGGAGHNYMPNGQPNNGGQRQGGRGGGAFGFVPAPALGPSTPYTIGAGGNGVGFLNRNGGNNGGTSSFGSFISAGGGNRALNVPGNPGNATTTGAIMGAQGLANPTYGAGGNGSWTGTGGAGQPGRVIIAAFE